MYSLQTVSIFTDTIDTTMQGKKKDAKITPIIFRERYEVMKPLLKGRKIEVATRVGCSPKRVANAISGQIASPELLEPILEAMKELAREELQKIQL